MAAKLVISDRTGAALTGAGISILLVRAAVIVVHSRTVLRRWVIGLAAVELVLDIATFGASVRWALTAVRRHRQLPLRLATAAIALHAGRVLVFVVGRLPPFKDFDVRPEHRADHDRRWSWNEVWFAGVMSILGVVGVFVVRCLIRRGETP